MLSRIFFACALAMIAAGSTPTFTLPVLYPAQNGPAAAISADFNGDGRLDLAVANIGSSSISIFPGKGDGTFGIAANISIPGGCTPNYLAVGAFARSTSKTDLLAVCGFQQRIIVIPNSATGFGVPIVTQTTLINVAGWGGELSVSPVAADFNGDGFLDLAISFASSEGADNLGAEVLLNNGDGTFRSMPPLPIGQFLSGSFAAGDFNRDGKMDLAFVATDTSASSATLLILTGDGKGSFQQTAQYPSNFTGIFGALITADVDRDGIPDLVSGGISLSQLNGSSIGSGIVVYKGKGDGTFQQGATLIYSGLIASLLPVDLHGTGLVDLVATAIDSSTQFSLAVQFSGNGDGTFQNGATIPLTGLSPFPFQFAAGDFNGDGSVDLAFPAYTINAVSQILHSGATLSSLLSLTTLLAGLPAGDIAVVLNTSPSLPVVSAVVNNASGAPRISPYTWITITGSHLSGAVPRVWAGSDFVNGSLPLSLDGISVTVDGVKAAVEYTSSGQINALAPNDNTTGSVSVQVTAPSGTSAPFRVPLAIFSPAFFTYSPPNNKYVAGTLLNGIYLAPPGTFGPGAISKSAKPGDIVVLYGTGFGPTNPQTAFGPASFIPSPLASAVAITIGGQPAIVGFQGMSTVGEDQFNVTVPAGLAAGDQPVVATIQGVSTQTGIFINVQP